MTTPSMLQVEWLPLVRLHPHPDNPRLAPRDDIVEQIRAQLAANGFDPAHALIVRPLGEDWQILAGHHRRVAAEQAGLDRVPCWGRKLDDKAAYMLLATSNAQGEPTPIERGRHALNSGMDIKAYAASAGRARTSVENEVKAARVAEAVTDIGHATAFSQLVEIHAAPKHEWRSLVGRVVRDNLTVEKTREEVAKTRIGRSAGAADIKPTRRPDPDDHDHVALEQWRKLDAATRQSLLPPELGDRPALHFNRQTSTDIEWAMWSWNPVTGCEHTCPYCYAREIANQRRMAEAYPFGFAPTLHPRRLAAPRFMQVPPEATTDTRYRNVFLGSMADMFGRWVPAEWIEAALTMIAEAPEWNFLCLTKFPKRMTEFNIPPNAWIGTTVDLQARVNGAEEAFAHVGSGVRWLSCEPLIEPLRFKHLDRFHWIVIGGASSTRQDGYDTPEWRPPFEWIADLVAQARDSGLKIYMKTNLGIENRIIELPFDAPVVRDHPIEAPAAFHYLRQYNDAR